jgi:hypothetical protein
MCRTCSAVLPKGAVTCPSCGTSTIAEPPKLIQLTPVSGLAHALQVMLGVCAAASLIQAGASAALAFSLAEYDGAANYTPLPLTTLDAVDGAASVAVLAAYASCVIPFVAWLFRVRHNAALP